MPIVIDQMDVQPSATSSGEGSARREGSGGGEAPPSEQQKEAELRRLLRARHERTLRLRAH